MNNFEEIILKKRSVWFHILVTYFTAGLWAIIYFLVKYQYNTKLKQQQLDKEKELELIEKNKPKLLKEAYFKVAGVTFENRQEIFKKIVKDGIKDGYIEPYDSMSTSEIKEYVNDYCDDVYEANNVEVSTIRLEPTNFDNEDAIEVYIKDFNQKKEYMVGYVPKKKIKETLEIIQTIHENPNYKLSADAYITGGKFKTVKYNYEKDKEVVFTDERNYGLNINLKIYNK